MSAVDRARKVPAGDREASLEERVDALETVVRRMLRDGDALKALEAELLPVRPSPTRDDRAEAIVREVAG